MQGAVRHQTTRSNRGRCTEPLSVVHAFELCESVAFLPLTLFLTRDGMLAGTEEEETFVIETTLLVVPYALTGSETVDPELGMPPLVLSALS